MAAIADALVPILRSLNHLGSVARDVTDLALAYDLLQGGDPHDPACAQRAIEPSVGDSYDNALAETINGLYKAELIHRRGPWRSFEAVECATLTWFNNLRLLEPIGNIPPAKAEERYYAMLGEPAMAA